jgi:GTPase-associated system helical domain
MMPNFNFIEAYKLLQPTVERGVVEARNEGFTKIVEKVTWANIVNLSRLAFNLHYDPQVYIDWFQVPLQKPDPHFFVAQDAAEAGRVAALVLRHFVSLNNATAALIVLAASYAGKRATFDNGELVAQSRDLIAASAKRGGMKAPSKEIGLRKAGDISKQKNEMTNAHDPAHVAAFVETAMQDLRGGTEAAVTALSEAYQVLRRDNLRLAEETDMLWWHVGDWSNILDIPRTSLSKKSIGLVSGVDLGAMVSISPGPYGVYGILTQTLRSTGDKAVLLTEAVGGLEPAQIARLALAKAPDVFPVFTALRLAAAGGDWVSAFKAEVPDAADVKLTPLELATQAFRERVSLAEIGWDK